MNDDITYHAPLTDEEEEPQAALDAMAKVNLFERLSELKSPPPAPPPQAPSMSSPEGGSPDPDSRRRPTKRLIAVAAALLLAVGAGGAYAYQSGRQQVAQEPGPSAAPGKQPTRPPSARPSARPSSKPSPPPRPAPAPAKPPTAPGTYTVQAGDTLITVGDKLKKDWRAIAAANNVPDPNFITPGQVLRIP